MMDRAVILPFVMKDRTYVLPFIQVTMLQRLTLPEQLDPGLKVSNFLYKLLKRCLGTENVDVSITASIPKRIGSESSSDSYTRPELYVKNMIRSSFTYPSSQSEAKVADIHAGISNKALSTSIISMDISLAV